MQPITVLSLFDGMSCWRLALERAWIPVASYYASEIDKYAIKVSESNRSDVIQVGDVREIRVKSDIKAKGIVRRPDGDTNIYVGDTGLDLLIGGSPCQWFSSAGKGLNFSDPRSKLFFEFVRILNEAKPRFFILENVKMKKEWQNIISEHLFGVQPVEIDSALVSAQRRKRLYRVWKRNEDWSYSQVAIKQPKDKGILLKDILEQEVDPKFYLSDKAIELMIKYLKPDYEITGKSNTLTTELAHTIGKNMSPKLVAETGVALYNRDHWRFRGSLHGDKSPTIRCQVNGNVLCLTRDFLRRLTPIECERLQTLPDDYTAGVSNSQRYKMLGNGWTVDVIAHIFREMFRG